jgi:hypothetical protein
MVVSRAVTLRRTRVRFPPAPHRGSSAKALDPLAKYGRPDGRPFAFEATRGLEGRIEFHEGEESGPRTVVAAGRFVVPSPHRHDDRRRTDRRGVRRLQPIRYIRSVQRVPLRTDRRRIAHARRGQPPRRVGGRRVDVDRPRRCASPCSPGGRRRHHVVRSHCAGATLPGSPNATSTAGTFVPERGSGGHRGRFDAEASPGTLLDGGACRLVTARGTRDERGNRWPTSQH